jgi:hypothetical protein
MCELRNVLFVRQAMWSPLASFLPFLDKGLRQLVTLSNPIVDPARSVDVPQLAVLLELGNHPQHVARLVRAGLTY